MTSIIKNILCEMRFVPAAPFAAYKDTVSFNLLPFYEKNSSDQIVQVYLVLPLLESQLLELNMGEVFSYIAEAFRRVDAYQSDMEKNTSLVISVNRDVQSDLMTQVQIEIEDDPYFFKKYLFSYLDSEPRSFEQLKKEYGIQGYIDFIQAYILNRDNFQRFKDNAQNETMYRFISDLLVKIPIMPIEFRISEEFRTVDSYFKDESISIKAPILNTMLSVLNGEEKDLLETVDILIGISSALGD